MHSKSDNIEFIHCNNANEAVDEIFESLLLRNQISLETSVRGSDFIFDTVQLVDHILILQTR